MKRKEYNNGFKQYYYKCQHCGCESVTEKPLGGFQPPTLICNACGKDVMNTPFTLYYEDNSNIQPKVEPNYSEKEVERMFHKFFIENVKLDGNPMDVMFAFPNWFEKNKKK